MNNTKKLDYLSNQALISSEHYSSKYFAERVLDVYKRAIDDKNNKLPIWGRVKNTFKKGNHEEYSSSWKF